ncbi:hypothetical protein [Nocardioides sp. GY 10127]|uniref:hypothetical protein n=1 Tax=Nocardioides sp. GY 10127 TaxID=2569762 RepID=UPI0010A755F4|nr:hypothetical protein [Nocardioides sp. GY 10127]TIC82744.1 hypothetical protein E8D37_08630 [Nocardioides sp. GY 10127]
MPRLSLPLRVLGLVALLVVLQAPLASAWWTQHRLESTGTCQDVEAAVDDEGAASVLLPRVVAAAVVEDAGSDEAVDLTTRTYSVSLDGDALAAARDGSARVCWDADDPSSFVVVGQPLPLRVALVLDVVVLGAIGMSFALRRRRRPELRMVADDGSLRVEAAEPGQEKGQEKGLEPGLERLGGQRYRVTGSVESVDGEHVRLLVEERHVRLTVPAGVPDDVVVGASVQAVGTMIG